jgi:hypothetical protein
MLVSAYDGVIHTHLPFDLLNRIAFGLRVGQKAVPGAVTPPAVKAIEAGLPRPVPLRKVASGRAGAWFPKDTVHYRTVLAPLAPCRHFLVEAALSDSKLGR